MVVTLKLEAVGDDVVEGLPALRRRAPERVPVRYWRQVYGKARRPWVAEVTGASTDGRIARRFLRGQKDFSEANSMGSRGVYIYYHLYPGKVYEVHELIGWRRERRYFCRVEDGQVVEMGRAEALACLA